MKQEPNNPKNGIAGRLNMAGWRKHYVAAITADEDAWPQREPGSNLGRVFIILLLLHVFLIGAVVLYNVISPKAPPALTSASSEPARPSATHSGAAPLAVPKAVAISVAANTNAGPTTSSAAIHSSLKPIDTAIYDVRSGDNVPGIAAALGVSAEDLIKLNNLDNTELYPGRKLTYPKKTVAPTLKAHAGSLARGGHPDPGAGGLQCRHTRPRKRPARDTEGPNRGHPCRPAARRKTPQPRTLRRHKTKETHLLRIPEAGQDRLEVREIIQGRQPGEDRG